MRDDLIAAWAVIARAVESSGGAIKSFLIGSLVFVVVTAVMWLIASRGAPRSLRSAVEFMFPAKSYRHATSRIDYLHTAVWIVFWAPVLDLLFTLWSGIKVNDVLVSEIGIRSRLVAPLWVIVVYQSVAIILARDLGFWLGHYLAHRVPFLWRFHRAHHSAEELNLFTNFRVHPIDQVKGRAFVITFGAIATGLALYFTGSSALENGTIAVLGASAAFELVKDLFSHSHIRMSFGLLNYIVCAPVMHQIHHSAERRHRDKNMAEMFTLWDWIFGTLYVPKGDEVFIKGIDTVEDFGDRNPHLRLRDFYMEPVVTALRLVRSEASSVIRARSN
jgi:sterol desaturase/sphingolipid hydroxylase (fatty acid hydroxylase superfamily)